MRSSSALANLPEDKLLFVYRPTLQFTRPVALTCGVFRIAQPLCIVFCMWLGLTASVWATPTAPQPFSPKKQAPAEVDTKPDVITLTPKELAVPKLGQAKSALRGTRDKATAQTPPLTRPKLWQRSRRPLRDEEFNEIRRQMALDVAPIPPGLGGIFVPQIIKQKGVSVPFYVVNDLQGRQIAITRTGKKSFVFPGRYLIRIGTRATDSLPVYQVTVRAKKFTILRPRWAALIIRVVNEQLIGVRGTYDLIHLSSRRGVGTGIGADDNFGEKVRPWLLRPGIYMIVRVGDTYLARTNFFTVQVNQGQVTQFRLVQDRTTSEFLGGGVVLQPQRMSSSGAWRWNLQLSGNILWNRQENVQGTSSGNSFNFSTFIAGRVTLNTDQHFFLTTLNAELGATVPSSGDFRKSADLLSMQSIYILRLTRFFGPYVRAGFETTIFPGYYYFDPQDPLGQANGSVYHCDSKRCDLFRNFTPGDLNEIKLGDYFDPFVMKQGLGINFQAVRTSWLDLRLLAGFGFRQELDREIFQFNNDLQSSRVRCRDQSKRNPNDPLDISKCSRPNEQESHSTIVLFRKPSSHREGLEVAVVATGRITRFFNFATEFDALGQFIDPLNFDINWNTTLTLRLSHYASLIYRLRLRRDPAVPSANKWSTDQSLVFSLSLFF